MTAAEVIATFARAWNTEDDTERLGLLVTACLPDAVSAAPQGQTCGVEALSASIAEFRHVFPAATVSFGVPDGHGDFARVAWTTSWNNGQPPLTGEDFAQLAKDGRIRVARVVRRRGGCQPVTGLTLTFTKTGAFPYVDVGDFFMGMQGSVIVTP